MAQAPREHSPTANPHRAVLGVYSFIFKKPLVMILREGGEGIGLAPAVLCSMIWEPEGARPGGYTVCQLIIHEDLSRRPTSQVGGISPK